MATDKFRVDSNFTTYEVIGGYYILSILATDSGYQFSLKSPTGEDLDTSGFSIIDNNIFVPKEHEGRNFRVLFFTEGYQQSQYSQYFRDSDKIKPNQPWTKQAKHTKGFVSTKPKPKVPKFLTSLIKNITKE